MKFLRFLGQLILGLLGCLLVVAIAVVLLNLGDEAPSPEASARLATGGEATGAASDGKQASENDGAYALWAFDAPAGVDAIPLGRAVFAALAAVPPERVAQNDWSIHPPYQPEPIEFPARLACIDPNSACIDVALSNPEVVRQWTAAHTALLERLAAIDVGQHWGPIPWLTASSAPLPPIRPLITLFSLSLDRAAVAIHERQLDAGINALEQDVRIARRLLRASDSVVMKSVASDLLRRAMLAYSEILRAEQSQPAAITRLAASLERTATDLSGDERDMTRVLAFEARRASDLAQQVANPPGDLQGSLVERIATRAAPLLFKPQATVNLEAQLFEIEAVLQAATPQQFAAQKDAVAAAFAAKADQFGQLNWHTAYNPLGKIMASYVPNLLDYMARIHDDATLMRAVRAQAFLMDRHVHFGEAQNTLDAAGPPLWDPYLQQPFRWQAADAAIAPTQFSSRGVPRVKIPLG